ncbi:hypothetical protein A4X06_0g8482 [Tilletia controversa]|uniref:Integrase catalytic domain-containing protein n=1 Tax=Tilletia controversa TaxID=13291 RepID=A0A8X7MKA8_9BASI|nr:hypothetical protein CF328_g9031 [Tilletia controversa]KAE8239151.1 hypothetical protein A4X06_0g8482 [Tilletia controversa]
MVPAQLPVIDAVFQTLAGKTETLLGRAEAVGLNFSPTKCTFGVSSLVLLGRKVSGAGLTIWQDRAAAVTELRRPTNPRDLYHVLGLFGYYRPFIPNFARLAEPLTKLTKSWRYEHADGRYRLINAEGRPVSADRVVFPWSLAAQRSFDALKFAIANPAVLAHPDPNRPYLLYVDASKHAFAAVLHQTFERDVSGPTVSTVPTAQLNVLRVGAVPPHIARERWTEWLRIGCLVRFWRRGRWREMRCGPLRKGFWCVEWMVVWRSLKALCRIYFCQAVKLPRRVGELRIDDDPSMPFEVIAVDLALGLPRTRNGVDAILVMQDVFSRMVLLQPCSSEITAEGIAAVIADRILRLGWRPKRLVSDSEARMTGAVMQALATSLGATMTPSPPHHQQANSVERFVQTVQNALRSMCLTSSSSLDRRAVPAVELAINSMPNVSTGQRPFDLVFISHPRIVHAVFDALEHDGVGSFPERLPAAGEHLNEARRHVLAAREEQKRRYDQRRRPLLALSPGDRVYVRLTDRPIPGAKDGRGVSPGVGFPEFPD